MPNELLLILSLLITFSFVLAAFYFFKEQGLFLWDHDRNDRGKHRSVDHRQCLRYGNDVRQYPVCFNFFSDRYPK